MKSERKIALNTSTIRGYELGICEQIDVAAQAGYDAIEPWLRDIDAFTDAGGTLAELRQRLDDAGLTLAGGIAFWTWADQDPDKRKAGIELARREMTVVAELGGAQAAAPPFGDVAGVSLDSFVAGFAALSKVGRETGVTPLLELWGHALRLSTLAEVLYVAAAAGGRAKVLLDVYHLYKGGNDLESMSLVSGTALGLLHVNDYPATPPRETIVDADRVWPGDGVTDFGALCTILDDIGYGGMLSVELFNPGYWQTDALSTAKTGLEKTRQAFGL